MFLICLVMWCNIWEEERSLEWIKGCVTWPSVIKRTLSKHLNGRSDTICVPAVRKDKSEHFNRSNQSGWKAYKSDANARLCFSPCGAPSLLEAAARSSKWTGHPPPAVCVCVRVCRCYCWNIKGHPWWMAGISRTRDPDSAAHKYIFMCNSQAKWALSVTLPRARWCHFSVFLSTVP